MRKVDNQQKNAKTANGKKRGLCQMTFTSKKVSEESACMSAPGKNVSKPRLSNPKNTMDEQLNVRVEKDAISQFSSCTAKTSPSTDNNSSQDSQSK